MVSTELSSIVTVLTGLDQASASILLCLYVLQSLTFKPDIFLQPFWAELGYALALQAIGIVIMFFLVLTQVKVSCVRARSTATERFRRTRSTSKRTKSSCQWTSSKRRRMPTLAWQNTRRSCTIKWTRRSFKRSTNQHRHL
jgi:hypothetical protein